MDNEAITKNDLRAILQELGMPFTPLDYYPIGSYYETSDGAFDPNTAWGGTWIEIQKPSVVTGTGTVTVNSATTRTLCSITLQPNTEYVVFGWLSANTGVEMNVGLFLSVTGTVQPTYIQPNNRLRQHSGGGPLTGGYIKTGNSTATATLSNYGYYTTSHTETGSIVAVPVNVQGADVHRWRRNA